MNRDFAVTLYWVQIWVWPPISHIPQGKCFSFSRLSKTGKTSSYYLGCWTQVRPSVTDDPMSLPLALTYPRGSGCSKSTIHLFRNNSLLRNAEVVVRTPDSTTPASWIRASKRLEVSATQSRSRHLVQVRKTRFRRTLESRGQEESVVQLVFLGSY